MGKVKVLTEGHHPLRLEVCHSLLTRELESRGMVVANELRGEREESEKVKEGGEKRAEGKRKKESTQRNHGALGR